METKYEGLQSSNFIEYKKQLQSMSSVDLSVSEFYLMLRPYYWYVFEPGFQDIYDLCSESYEIIRKYKTGLKEELMMSGIERALAAYTEEEIYDSEGWRFLYGGIETAISSDARKISNKLKELNRGKESETLKKLSEIMKEIESAKHITCRRLRSCGKDFLKQLDLIHTFPPYDQSFILHALDEFKGNEDVKNFYKEFINKTKYDNLKKDAEKYIQTI
jgi:hypothetical protein